MNIPEKYRQEYEAAASYYARKGDLPMNMGSPGAVDYISIQPTRFLERVAELKGLTEPR